MLWSMLLRLLHRVMVERTVLECIQVQWSERALAVSFFGTVVIEADDQFDQIRDRLRLTLGEQSGTLPMAIVIVGRGLDQVFARALVAVKTSKDALDVVYKSRLQRCLFPVGIAGIRDGTLLTALAG